MTRGPQMIRTPRPASARFPQTRSPSGPLSNRGSVKSTSWPIPCEHHPELKAKPDRRLFQAALDGINVAAGNAMYVGNDMHRGEFPGSAARAVCGKIHNDLHNPNDAECYAGRIP